MAHCATCGKTTAFGCNKPFSQKRTRRTFRPNLQKVQVYADGRSTQKVLCAKCIKTIAK